MQVHVTIEDGITPDLNARTAAMPGKVQSALQAAGLALASLAVRAFSMPSLRPTVWAALKPQTIEQRRKQGFRGSAPLRASGTLFHSPRIIAQDAHSVTVGSDRTAGVYSLAAIHQLGAPKRRIPPRPFFPVTPEGELTPVGRAQVEAIFRRIFPG